MSWMLITILVVLAHESDGARHIVLENGIVVGSENFREVLVAKNDSASLRLKINDEFNKDERDTCRNSPFLPSLWRWLLQRKKTREEKKTEWRLKQDEWLREDMDVLEKARQASASSAQASISDDEHVRGQKKTTKVDHAVEYIERFLLKYLCTQGEVEKILFNKNAEKDKLGIEGFLNQYIDWAEKRELKILHEFSVDKADVVVVGDLHGHFAAMRAAFRVWFGRVAKNPTTRLVFLGDFVDRGKRDVETAIAIMALQMWMNGPVVVLRGNHENDLRDKEKDSWTFARSLSTTFGGTLLDDGTLKRKSPVRGLWDKFYDAFWNLPAAAIMTRDSQSYLMLHGGWTESVLQDKNIKLLKETRAKELLKWRKETRLHREPQDNFTEKETQLLEKIKTLEDLVKALVWSDVMHKTITGKYGKSSRSKDGSIFTYGYEAIEDMFKALGVDWCISGHKHENLLWMPAKSLGKGHVVVVSADVYSLGKKQLAKKQLPKVVVIETKNPLGHVCCCWRDKIKNKSPTEQNCKYRFTKNMCCTYNAGSSCTFKKYSVQQDPTFCEAPRFVELSPLISKYTLDDDITEGNWQVFF